MTPATAAFVQGSGERVFEQGRFDSAGRRSAVAGAPALDDLVGRARELIPLVQEHAGQFERDGRISSELTALFRQAGLLRLMQPGRYGGYEYGFTAFMDIVTELGRADASSAWCYSLGAIHQWFMATFPAEAQKDVWGENPDAIACGSYAPSCTAKSVDGGYLISGRWSFASNCDNSDWALLGAFFPPQAADARPSAGFLLAPRRDWEIDHESWDTAGLAGTGSKDLVIRKEVFVPRHRKVTFAEASSNDPPGARVNSNPIYRIPFLSAVPVCLVAPAIGNALGATETFLQLAGVRVTRGAVAGAGNRIVDFYPVQSRFAEACAAIDAARLLVYRDTAEVEDMASAGRLVTVADRIRNRRDHAYATRLLTQAVDMLFSLVGGQGIQRKNPVQRYWRDGNVIAKHISLNWDAVSAMYGQHQFGLEPRGQY